MGRPSSRYVCQGCGAAFLRWEGQCRTCGAWNTLVETAVQPATERSRRGATSSALGPAEPVALRDFAAGDAARLALGIAEFDRVLGGGLVAGSLVLLAGEPGIGKSTLALEVAAAVAAGVDQPVLYVSGEESPGQVRLRGARLGLVASTAGERLRILPTTDVEAVVEQARRLAPAALVVDSIQSLTSDALEGPPGSVGQVRESAHRLLLLAKGEGIPVLLIGHVTKDGSVAGPKTLEHLVDVVLSLEGDPSAAVRLLRATKNRFGSTEEVGLFEMSASGLRPLADPTELLLPADALRPPGSAVALLLEGSRPLLVEVQALVGGGGYGAPRRTASGIDFDRLSLLVAVLAKQAGIGIGSRDVYVTLAGGLRSREPALDLPLALALASSLRERPLAPWTVAAGEVSLAGEVRQVSGLERRLREAARLGYRRAIAGGAEGRGASGLRVVAVRTLREAIDAALEPAGTPPGARLAAVPVEGGAGA